MKHDLVKRWSPRYRGLSGWGVGGAVRSSFTRLKTFVLGGIAIPDTVVGLGEQRKGSLSDIYVAGNVGGGILKRFNITWDYPHLQIYIEPNKHYQQAESFDRRVMGQSKRPWICRGGYNQRRPRRTSWTQGGRRDPVS